MTDQPSTSARLRATEQALAESQAAFAASQQDVTRLEGERNRLAEHLIHANGHREAFRAQRDEAWLKLDEARAKVDELETTLRIFRNSQSLDVVALRTARDKAREELAKANAELAERPRLPETTDEIRAWFRERDLRMDCGPSVLFAELRQMFQDSPRQPAPGPEEGEHPQ